MTGLHHIALAWFPMFIMSAMSGCGQEPAPASTPGGTEASLNTLTGAEREEGWRLLFDGESFAGWRGLGRDTVPSAHWVIEDGAIRKIASGQVPVAPDGQPLDGGDLTTDATFEHFELRFEWKVGPGGNSGIKYNVSEAMSVSHPPRFAALGFEYQVLDDGRHPDAANGPNRTAGAVYDLVDPASIRVINPVGQFNTGRIVWDRGHAEHWVNGAKVAEFELGTARFDSLFARSKYLPIDGFADPRAGHIVLQDHGDDVWFRNLKIRTIPHD